MAVGFGDAHCVVLPFVSTCSLSIPFSRSIPTDTMKMVIFGSQCLFKSSNFVSSLSSFYDIVISSLNYHILLVSAP